MQRIYLYANILNRNFGGQHTCVFSPSAQENTVRKKFRLTCFSVNQLSLIFVSEIKGHCMCTVIVFLIINKAFHALYLGAEMSGYYA